MIVRSYFTSAVRDLLAHKAYSAINIFGLAVGMAGCLLIALFVRDELGYDSFVPAADRTYRIDVTFVEPGRLPEYGSRFMGAYAPLMKQATSDIEDVTRYVTNRLTVRAGENLNYENITFTDPNFLDFFGFDVPAGALDDQLAIVLTQSAAERYFEGGDAVGQVLTINGDMDYRVAAVMPDVSRKSHLVLSFIAPLHETEHAWVNRETMSGNTASYVRMKPGRSTEPLHGLLSEMIDANVERRVGEPVASESRAAAFVKVSDIYLKSRGGVDFKPGGDIRVVYGFVIVALLILVIATANYVNLATAKAMKRTREVGLRKVMGATRRQLVAQFMGESLVVTFVALILALALAEMALPVFNASLGRDLALNYTGDAMLTGSLLALTLIVGAGAGLYPAFYLSSFRPAGALGGEAGKGRSAYFRQTLVFIQFAIAIALAAGTTVVARQTLYANTMDPGYAKEGVLLLRSLRQNNLVPKIATINQELSRVPGVAAVSASQFVPSDGFNWNSFMHFEGDPEGRFGMDILSHESGFFDLYGIDMVLGRTLERDRLGDSIQAFPDEPGVTVSTNATLNQSALGYLGIASAEAAIGRQIVWPRNNERSLTFTIVGVVEDFHIRSVRDEIRPMLFLSAPQLYRTISIRYNTADFPAFLGRLGAAWARVAPGVPLDYQVLEDRIDSFYQSENQQTRVFITFAGLALVIAAVGLLGLAAFAAERRTKEIGIRKVLGASTGDIVKLMVAQFSKPVVLANLVALPVAWWLMSDWLESFVYRVDLGPIWFAAAGGAALLVAWVTVSGHSLRVAHANPIVALRYE